MTTPKQSQQDGLDDQKRFKRPVTAVLCLCKFSLICFLRHYRSGHVPVCVSEADYRSTQKTGASCTFM